MTSIVTIYYLRELSVSVKKAAYAYCSLYYVYIRYGNGLLRRRMYEPLHEKKQCEFLPLSDIFCQTSIVDHSCCNWSKELDAERVFLDMQLSLRLWGSGI